MNKTFNILTVISVYTGIDLYKVLGCDICDDPWLGPFDINDFHEFINPNGDDLWAVQGFIYSQIGQIAGDSRVKDLIESKKYGKEYQRTTAIEVSQYLCDTYGTKLEMYAPTKQISTTEKKEDKIMNNDTIIDNGAPVSNSNKNVKYQYLAVNTSVMSELYNVIDSINDLSFFVKEAEENASKENTSKPPIGTSDLDKVRSKVEDLTKLLNKKQREVGHVCLRVELPDCEQKVGPFNYKCTLAFSSPSDMFNKKKARKICDGKSRSVFWTKTFASQKRVSLRGMIYRVLGSSWYGTDVQIPGWVWTKEIKEEIKKIKEEKAEAYKNSPGAIQYIKGPSPEIQLACNPNPCDW